MQLLPPKAGVCPICAVDHKPTAPHDGSSLYYSYRFFEAHGRWPTWADAIAHCAPQVQAYWKQALQDRNRWTEPVDGQVIADPPAESFRQPVGDLKSRSFGPQLTE